MAAAPALRRSPQRKSGGKASAGHPRKGSPCTPGAGEPTPASCRTRQRLRSGSRWVLVQFWCWFSAVSGGVAPRGCEMERGGTGHRIQHPSLQRGRGFGRKAELVDGKIPPGWSRGAHAEDARHFPRLSPPRGLSGRPVRPELCPSPRERGRGGTRPKDKQEGTRTPRDGGGRTGDKASTTGERNRFY